jgi:crotonobetainyl-CoA:carnitine CoA-transferase CaiB-like acyl-CoA transferase
MSGFMDLTGEEDGPPTKVAGSPSDYIAALYGALAVSNAVLLRSQTGEGQYIDLSLLDGVVSTLASQVGQYMATGDVLRRTGNLYPNAAADGAFATADGCVYISTGGDRQWASLCRVLGWGELIDRDGYKTRPDRYKHYDEINGRIAEWMCSRSTADVMGALLSENISCGRVNTLAEMADDPQIEHRGLLFQFETDAWGKVPGVAMPFQSDKIGWVEPSAPPKIGEHNADILGSMLGLTRTDVEQLAVEGVL